MIGALLALNPPDTSRRKPSKSDLAFFSGMRRNSWGDDAPGHYKAAKKGAARKGYVDDSEFRGYMRDIGREGGKRGGPSAFRKKVGIFKSRKRKGAVKMARKRKKNAGYKSKRRKNPGFKGGHRPWNKGRKLHRWHKVKGYKHGSSRVKSHRRRTNPPRRHRRNPSRRGLSLRHNPIMASIKQVVSKDLVVNGLQIGIGGMLGVGVPNLILNSQAVGKYAPAWLKKGPLNYLFTLVSGGLLGYGAGKLAKSPRLARNIYLGTFAFTVAKALGDYLRPAAAAPGASQVTTTIAKALGLAGLGQSELDRAVERAVAANLSGMGEFVTPPMLPGGIEDTIEPAGIDGMGEDDGLDDSFSPEDINVGIPAAGVWR